MIVCNELFRNGGCTVEPFGHHLFFVLPVAKRHFFGHRDVGVHQHGLGSPPHAKPVVAGQRGRGVNRTLVIRHCLLIIRFGAVENQVPAEQ